MIFAMAEAQSDKSIKTIRELLGINAEDFAPVSPDLAAKAPPAPDLPVAQALEVEPERKEIPGPEIPEVVIAPRRRFLRRDLVRYPAIFLAALLFFYVLLNFTAVFRQISGIFSKPESTPKSAVPSDLNLAAYQKWTRKFYVFLNDPKVFAPEEDPDGDGLLNSQEFRLATNPLLWDTDRDGFDDGREVLGGYNPSYDGRLLAWQEKILSDYIDLSAIAGRKQLQGVSGERFVPSGAPRPDEVSSPLGEFQIEVSKPGNLSIPKLGVDAQIIWSQVFENMEEDLKYGVAHHPATPYPGESGTASIHGHSSGNPWDGNFKTIFTRLNLLAAGDEIFVTVYGTGNEIRKYRYMIRSAQVFNKTDTKQFDAGAGYFLNLSTSWPIGTARQRYVVTTELVGLQP